MAAAAQKMTDAFVAEVAAAAGTGTGLVRSLMGITTGAKGETSVAGLDSGVSALVGATSKAWADKAGDFQKLGSDVFIGNLIKGLDAATEAVCTKVEEIAAAMIAAMIAALRGPVSIPGPPPQPRAPNPLGFASGTSWFGGGLALVGERGPELVRLPRGASVWDSARTRAAMAPTLPSPVGTQGRGDNLGYQITVNLALAAGSAADVGAAARMGAEAGVQEALRYAGLKA